MTQRIYLDHAATTPVLPTAQHAMAEALARWHNPSSPHAEGRQARAALEQARERIKRALGWTGELIFTSGASEALSIALGRSTRRIIVSPVEHEAVFRAAPRAEVLPVGARAQVPREAIEDSLRTRPPALVAVQHINSETGVEQPVGSLAEAVRAGGGILLSDCSQSAGKVALPDADLIVVSAHKLGGPPGIGALLVRDLAMIEPDGGQEFGYRGGTQNVPAALGFAAAVEAFQIGSSSQGYPHSEPMVSWLGEMGDCIRDLEHPIGLAGGTYQPETSRPGAEEPGPRPMFAGWIIALTMPNLSAAAQLIRFDAAGIAVSAGSACSSGTLKTSRALAAFGVTDEQASRTIRVSFGWSTTADDIRRFEETWLDMALGARTEAA